MITWNGKDIDVFLKILACVDEKQTVEITMEDCSVKTVSTFDELRGILPPRNENTELTQQEYDELMQLFMPSREMREYLLKDKPNRYQVMDIIIGAPVSLETKAGFFQKLMCRDDLFHAALDEITTAFSESDNETEEKIEHLKWHSEYSFTAHYKALRLALDALRLKPGEILLLNEAWYDEDFSDENESRGSVPLLSLDAALRYIRDEMKEEEWNDETECWTKLEKWVPGENGEMEHLYTYYLIRDEIVFFEKMKLIPDEHWFWCAQERKYSSGNRDLNIPIPYQPGDIVKANCLPFAPVKHVLLLEVGNDCCGVSALYRRKDGKWETGALKHGHFMESYVPMISPLYRISSYEGCLPPEEQILQKISEHINGDPEKGRQLWESFHKSCRSLRTSELFKLIGYEKGFTFNRKQD